MFKKPEQIKPLPQGMADAFSRTLERQGFVAPAPVQQPPTQTAPQTVTEAVKEVPPSDLAKSPNTVKGTVAHKLGVGLDMKQMMQHARSNRDIDIDGDVDALDKTTPDEITGAEKENQTPKMMKKYEKEKQHTKVGNALESVDNGSCQCDNPDTTSKGNCSECGKPVDMSEALDPVDKKALKKDFSDREDKDIDNDGDTDSSDEYLHKRRQAVSKSLTKESATLTQNSLEEEDTFAGWIAIYNGKKIEIKKDQAKDLYGAKQLAIKQLKVPKSGVGVLAIKPAYESYEETQLEDIEEGWDDMMKAAKERAKPQPNGAGGKKQGTAYGGSKQKDAPKKDDMKESVKVGDKVSFDHPMTAAPGKTMKKVGTVKKIEGDTAHLKSSTKYGTLSYQKKVSELRKEEVELGEGAVTAKDDRGPRGVTQEEVAELAEAPSYKLYHTTFSAAVQEAIAVAKKQGYEVDEEDWQNKVATGPKKPSKDKTNSYTIDLTKGGSPTKKKLQIQVYNMGEKYELNTYVQ